MKIGGLFTLHYLFAKTAPVSMGAVFLLTWIGECQH